MFQTLFDEKEKKVEYLELIYDLIFALSGITIGLEFMQEEAVALEPKLILMIAALLLYYLFLFLLCRYGKCDARPSKGFIFQLCATGAVFAVLMILFKNNMYLNIAITVLFVAAIFTYMMLFKKKKGC